MALGSIPNWGNRSYKPYRKREKETKPKVSRRKEILKTEVEMDEIEAEK